MYKKDNLLNGFLVGSGINVVLTTIIWLIVGVIGFSPIELSGKLYFLAIIPAIFIMRTAMKKYQFVKMGSGVLLSIILFAILFFVGLRFHWI